jgi:probable F420-dependent oxidoreductase
MKLGVTIFPTDTAISPVRIAREAEDRGFESLWFAEHSHIPVRRATPRGGVAGAGPLPEKYWRTLDSFVALAAASSVTSRIKLATGICLVAQRDPIWLAKEVASLDTLSGGRVLFGIGYGWNKEEMAQHGIAYRDRRRILREKILAMKSLWIDDVASFDGEFVHLEPSWSWPKPVQRPHPPIILGGDAGPRTRADIVEFCDGWMPLGGRHPIVERIGQLRSEAEAAGRDPAEIEISVYGAAADPASLAELAAAGVERAIFNLPSEHADTVLPLLDAQARLLDQIP